MKTIANQKLSWKTPQGEKFETDYFGMLRTAIENIPSDGLNISQMKERLNILTILNAAGDDEVKFENAEFKLLYSMMQAQIWVVMSQDVVDFYTYLDKLKDK